MFGLFKKKNEAKTEASSEQIGHDDCCGSGSCGGDCGCEHEMSEGKQGGCGDDCGCAHEEGKEKKHSGCGCC